MTQHIVALRVFVIISADFLDAGLKVGVVDSLVRKNSGVDLVVNMLDVVIFRMLLAKHTLRLVSAPRGPLGHLLPLKVLLLFTGGLVTDWLFCPVR